MKKRKIQIDLTFKIALIVAVFFSIIYLVIVYQEETVDSVCHAIEKKDSDLAKEKLDDVWFINLGGEKNKTVLMAACEFGDSTMIHYALANGADPNATINGRLYPLELYCGYGYGAGIDELELLLSYGALQSQYTIKPAVFHLASNFSYMDKKEKEMATEMTILLLKRGAPLVFEDTSLLHIAAKNDMDDLFYTIVHTTSGLQLLVMEDNNGLTPWEIAVKYGAVGVQKVIRDLELEYAEEQEKEDQEQNQDDTNTEAENDDDVWYDTPEYDFLQGMYGN
jgi:ankyrin repeat protein